MARIRAVLVAIGRAVWRDLRSLQSITGNNFFYFLLLIGLQPESAAFFTLILLALLLFPLSASPMNKVPRDRWLLWPLTPRERFAVQAGCLLLSPVTWITPILLTRAGWSAAVFFVVAAVVARGLLFVSARVRSKLPRFDLLRDLPAPPGWFGGLFRLHLREMLTTLDPYIALLLAAATLAYRWLDAKADPSAFHVMALVVVIALSTGGQVLFGLDGGGILRYRLMPVRGWQLLAAKDAAFLALVVVLTAPLDLAGGLTAACVALAIGHHESVLRPNPQVRWRFTSGVLTAGLIQAFALTATTATEWQKGWPVLLISVFLFAASLWFYGRQWDHFTY